MSEHISFRLRVIGFKDSTFIYFFYVGMLWGSEYCGHESRMTSLSGLLIVIIVLLPESDVDREFTCNARQLYGMKPENRILYVSFLFHIPTL